MSISYHPQPRLFRALIFLDDCHLLFALSSPENCGVRSSTRIVGGADSKPGDWPWQGMLKASHGSSTYCGGTLVAPQWLVTASHCVTGQSASAIHIR